MAALSKWVPIGDAPNPLETSINPLKLTTIQKIGGIYCHICHVTIGNKKDYDSHYVEHGMSSSNITYTCVVCHKEIVGYPSFRGHCYLQHVTKDKFRCEYCEKLFSKLCILKSHIQAMHHHKCATCNKEFKNQKDLTSHQILHKNEQGPPYDCKTCNQQIDSTDTCEQHIEDHCHMSYSCPICDETIPDIKDAASHLTKHFGNVLTKEHEFEDDEITEIKTDSSIDLLGGIFCNLCDQTYKARPDFDNHYTLDHVDKPILYACNICGKEFEKYIMFANHCYDHYARGRFQCEVCFKSFPRLSLLVTHVEAYHAEEGIEQERPFSCHVCDHNFKTLRRLKDHQRKAHNISYHQCPDKDCKMTFKTSKELAFHVKQHKATDLFCRTCGLRFTSLPACERHLHVHRKKAYSCPVCDRSYGEKYLVMKHVNQHFAVVLHICKICGKAYTARHRLNHHMNSHTEDKKYKCTYCSKGFTKTYLLKQHINIHTGLRPFSCTACSKTFASQPNLTKHMKCVHNITKINKQAYTNVTKNPNSKSNAKVEKTPNVTNDAEIPNEESIITLDNNNIDEPANSSEMVYEPPAFEDDDDWRTDRIDPNVLAMLEENIGSTIDSIADAAELGAGAENITELENALWGSNTPTASALSYLSPVEPSYPREYGPEFVNAAPGATPAGDFVHLDDHFLPHIDPRLTVRQERWEPPVFTKLCEYADIGDARYSVMNTDIF